MCSSRVLMKLDIIQIQEDNLTSTHFSVKASVSTSVRAGTIFSNDCDPRDKLSRTTALTLSGLPRRTSNICSIYELFIKRTRSSTSHLSCTQNKLIREQVPHRSWSKLEKPQFQNGNSLFLAKRISALMLKNSGHWKRWSRLPKRLPNKSNDFLKKLLE